MPAPYSQDLRERVAGAIAQGLSARAAARRFDISISTAIRWAQRWRGEGHAKARAMGGDHRSRLKEHRAFLLELIAQEPDLTLREMRSALAARGVTVGLMTVWRFLAAHKLTLKKRASTPPSRSALMWSRRAACSSAASPPSTPTG
jgi:transposase